MTFDESPSPSLAQAINMGATPANTLYDAAPFKSLKGLGPRSARIRSLHFGHILARLCLPKRRIQMNVRCNIGFPLKVSGSLGPPAVGLTQNKSSQKKLE